jgi:hypothetical protein
MAISPTTNGGELTIYTHSCPSAKEVEHRSIVLTRLVANGGNYRNHDRIPRSRVCRRELLWYYLLDVFAGLWQSPPFPARPLPTAVSSIEQHHC